MARIITRRDFLLGTGALGGAAVLGLSPRASLAQGEPVRGGTFRIAIADFNTADTLEPQTNETRFMMNLQYQLRNCLVEVGPGGVLVPELATSWEGNDDSTVWTFQLRDGVEFHDAKTMDADDVVWSLNLHRGPDTISMAKTMLEQVSDVRATAPREVTVTLAAPNAGFPSLMALVNLLVVPADDVDFAAGNGTGGYVLERFEPGVGSRVTRFPNYWKEGRAHFDAVELSAVSDVNARTTALQTGEIDAMNYVDSTTAALLERLPNVALIRTEGKQQYAFSMNTTDERFANADARMAMKLAIDRQAMLDKIVNGYGSIANDQPISKAYEYYAADFEQHAYDPDKARALFKRAGLEGATLPLHVSDTPFTGATDMAQLYADQVTAAGITIEVVREPADGYWSNVWGKKPLFATKWSGRVNEDVIFSMAYSKASIGDWNETSWNNPTFERALVAARGEKDDAKRRALYAECQSLVSSEGGMVSPVWADFIDATATNVAHGEIGNDWELDGARASERWWFEA